MKVFIDNVFYVLSSNTVLTFDMDKDFALLHKLVYDDGAESV